VKTIQLIEYLATDPNRNDSHNVWNTSTKQNMVLHVKQLVHPNN